MRTVKKARDLASKSKDEEVQQSAAAYGEPGEDNGVLVTWGRIDKPADVHYRGNIARNRLDIQVTFTLNDKTQRTSARDPAFVAAVGHEGRHVMQFAKHRDTVTDATLNGSDETNLNRYTREAEAYRVTDKILRDLGATRHYEGQPLGFGTRQKDLSVRIDQILNTGYQVTPEQPGPRLMQ